MKKERKIWRKQIKEEEQENNKDENAEEKSKHLSFKEVLEGHEDSKMYIGSLVLFGTANERFHTMNKQDELILVKHDMTTVILRSLKHEELVDISIVFGGFFRQIMSRSHLGTLRFFCQVEEVEQSKSAKKMKYNESASDNDNGEDPQVKSRKKKKKKRQPICFAERRKVLKKVIPVRLDIYITRNIYNEKSPRYSQNLVKLDNMQSLLNTLKASTDEYRDLRRQMMSLVEDQLNGEKIGRGFLLYLIEKAQVKVLNRSFIKPPPKLNYFMRQFRRMTIGLITKNARSQNRTRHKIATWKRAFQWMSLFYPCIMNKKMMSSRLSPDSIVWGEKQSYCAKQLDFENTKFRIKIGEHLPLSPIDMDQYRKKIMEEIGAYGFEDDESDDDLEDADQKNDADEIALSKKNEALMEKFQTENKHFKKHPTPKGMISQLKPYQMQALQWMKYREGKIAVEQLFEKQYVDEVENFEYERQLSPFWEEIETIQGEKFFVNYLTGEFTQKFHDWKSIRGGILADEMGLGKTVMTLSLLADQNWEGLNLIVVPVAVLMQWKEQVVKHCGQEVLVYEFHADSKSRRKKNLYDYQIVLITYSTLGHEYKHYHQNRNTSEQKFIFDYDFQRVILDEAHNIKGTNTLQFNAVLNLKSKYSWCLTGTLIQNSEQDLFAIFKFLKVEVFSEQSWWNQYIKNAGCIQAKLNVIQTVLRPIVLRRTKASTSSGGEAIISLTKRNEFVIRPQFSHIQAKVYKKLEAGMKQFFKTNSSSTKNYAHVFQIISKLRQFCCHPSLIFSDDINNLEDSDIEKMLNMFLEGRVAGKAFRDNAINTILSGTEICVICLSEPEADNAVLTNCGHYYCETCLRKIIQKHHNCPICRAELNETSYIKKSDLTLPEEINTIEQSSKIIAIVKVLEEIQERNEKCVIFTQWIKIIGIIDRKLLEKGIEFGIIDGSMSIEKRQRTIRRFKQKETCRFLIVSIRAGGTGLNLANANNVMICDPWWNPSHQDQAIGRVHRLGQNKDVNVYRFLMKGSIEQKIEKMHESKRHLANQVMMQRGSTKQARPAAEQLIRLLD